MQGVRGVRDTLQKANLKKVKRKRRKKLTKSRILTKSTTMSFTNGSKVMSFRGVTPLTPLFFKEVQSPHLPKIYPAYAPANRLRLLHTSNILKCLTPLVFNVN